MECVRESAIVGRIQHRAFERESKILGLLLQLKVRCRCKQQAPVKPEKMPGVYINEKKIRICW